MMKSDEKYQVPAWMRPLLPLLCNTGGNDPEELLNDTETTASANVVRYVLIVAVRSQVDLLQLLYRKGLLRTEIPGGFSPEEAQALLDNLVRSHISKALSGERMAARDRNADLAWIGQQLVDAAWFVRATLEAHGMSVGNESPPAPPETMPDIQTRELVMLIKRLASSLKAVKPDSCVVREAQDWLRDRKTCGISQIFSGEPGMYILRRDTPIMIVSYQGWSGGHAACPLHSPE